MSQKQLQRFRVVRLVESGRMTVKEATGKMGVYCQQAKRIRKRVREKGAQGLLHGNAGHSPQHRIPEQVRKTILDLSCKNYAKFNDRDY